MARLAVRYYHLYSLLISSFRRNISASALTTVHFYNDTACHNLLYTVQTDTNAKSGICTPVTGVEGVRPDYNADCAVTVYSDISSPYCSNGTLAPFGSCTNTTINSYTVDCEGGGSNTGSNTTIYPSSGETSRPSTSPPTTLSSTTESNPLTSTSSPSSSLAASLSSQTSSASSTGATPPSPSPSQAPKQGDGNGGLSRGENIGLGAGLGAGLGLLAICVLVIYLYKTRAPPSGSPSGNTSAPELAQVGSQMRASESGGLSNRNVRQSDQSSCADSSFPSLPPGSQPGL